MVDTTVSTVPETRATAKNPSVKEVAESDIWELTRPDGVCYSGEFRFNYLARAVEVLWGDHGAAANEEDG